MNSCGLFLTPIHGVTIYKNKRCGVCNITIKGKSYTLETPQIFILLDYIKLPENWKNVSNYHFKCSNGMFKIMLIYQTDDYTLLQIKRKNTSEKNLNLH